MKKEYETPLVTNVIFDTEGVLCFSAVNDIQGYKEEEFEW